MRIIEESEVPIITIPETINYWLVRADGGNYYDDFLLNNYIGISDNQITLELIKSIQHLVGIEHKHYKYIYEKTFADWSKQQISQSAKRTFYFVEKMNIGDIVLVPAKRSQYFLMGIIISNSFEITDEDLTNRDVTNYSQSNFKKRREIKWLKVVEREEISDKLNWILSAHQTIFDLNKYREYINQLIAPLYFDNHSYHVNLFVNKIEGLTNDEWILFHTFLRDLEFGEQEKTIVKADVQSPGIIEVITSNVDTAILAFTIFNAIFTDVELFGIKVKGLLPTYMNAKREVAETKKIDSETAKNHAETDSIKMDAELKKIDLEFKKIELAEVQKKMQDAEISKTAESLRSNLKIVPFDAGIAIQQQKQMGSSDGPDEI